MNGSAYYDFQASARGLHSNEDVEALADCMSKVYARLLSEWLPKDRAAAIYEVACGPGVFLRHLSKEGFTNLHGSDSSPCQIKLAQSTKASVIVADSNVELQKHPEKSWDCIVAIDFIEHLQKDTLIAFFSEAHRTLKREGRLILRAPNGDSPVVGRNLFNDITHFWAYTTISMNALLKMAGFKRVEFRDEACASIQQGRLVKVPIMRLSQAMLRLIVRSATREDIRYFSPSIYVAAFK